MSQTVTNDQFGQAVCDHQAGIRFTNLQVTGDRFCVTTDFEQKLEGRSGSAKNKKVHRFGNLYFRHVSEMVIFKVTELNSKFRLI